VRQGRPRPGKTIVETRSGSPREATQSWATSALEFRATQPSTIPLNLHHDPALTVGEIVSLHRDEDGRMWATARADADALLDVDEKIYFSAETSATMDGKDIILTGVALCLEPAQVGARPVKFLPGDLDDNYERSKWQLPRGQRERVEQAAVELRQRGPTTPVRVHDPAPQPERIEGGWLVDDEFIPSTPLGRPPGALEFRPCKILSIR
jgi:hypothetical protein